MDAQSHAVGAAELYTLVDISIKETPDKKAQVVNETEIERDEDYWFDDGSIVVIARGTAFKVHKSVLSRNSVVFHDLSAIPQPLNSDNIDGCPSVRISDSPAEFKTLLRALYDASRDSWLYQLDKRLPFSMVAGLYELAHKYQIDHLSEQMLLRIKSCFTNDLDAWDTLEHVITGEGQRHSTIRSPALEVSSTTDAFRAISLVRRSGDLTMLPVAIYLASFHPARVLLSGIPQSDGTIDTLSPADLVCCLEARVLFARWTYTKLAWLVTGRVAPTCATRGACTDALDALSMKIERGLSKPKGAYFALDPFAAVVSDLANEFHVCRECTAALQARTMEDRREMWSNLPRDLGLDIGDWKNL
ncbi:hypothetical protein C8Q77DRAFT_1218173 [Trametes polyzona]|nr:hypothetical protein C8Q77DRAFT_1218173 [Trametes polyzona]